MGKKVIKNIHYVQENHRAIYYVLNILATSIVAGLVYHIIWGITYLLMK